MLFCFAFCVAIGGWLFSPEHLKEFGQSLVYATISLSNFFFWNVSGYFDTDNGVRPLLHTWSLSIEEQFYFIWPGLLLLLYKFIRRSFIPWIFLALGALSIMLNMVVLEHSELLASLFGTEKQEPFYDPRSTIFYLLPFRVFEFVLGGILVWVPTLKPNNKLINELCFLLGLALIGYALFTFDGSIPFPGTNALLPCIGASLLIYSGPKHKFVSLVNNKPLVFVGLISYSLYLIHWPIIVFYRYLSEPTLTGTDYTFIIATSVAAAYLMYRFVEQPFRHPNKQKYRHKQKPFLISSLTLALLFVAVGQHAASSGGWLWRYPKHLVTQLKLTNEDYRAFFWENIRRHQAGFSKNGKPKILIIGDSMAADLVNVIVESNNHNKIDIASIVIEHNCKSYAPLRGREYRMLFPSHYRKCREQHRSMISNSLIKEADAIILASYWLSTSHVKFIERTVAALNAVGKNNIFVQGPKDQNIPGTLFLAQNIFKPDIYKLRTPISDKTKIMAHALRESESNFSYFDLLEHFCDSSGCQRVTKEGYLITFDSSHLTAQGAQFVGRNLSDTQWFSKLVELGVIE